MGHHGEINTKAYVIGLLKEMEKAYQKKTILNINLWKRFRYYNGTFKNFSDVDVSRHAAIVHIVIRH